jgi:hypothetical protein
MGQFEECLEQVNTLIFIYGKVAKDWVLERIRVAVQLIAGKNYGISTLAVYLGPPRKSPEDIKLNQPFIKIHIIDDSDSDQFDPDTLTPLFERMSPGGAS